MAQVFVSDQRMPFLPSKELAASLPSPFYRAPSRWIRACGLYAWSPTWPTIVADLVRLGALNWLPLDERLLTTSPSLLSCLASQLADVRSCEDGTLWTARADLEHALGYPVLLGWDVSLELLPLLSPAAGTLDVPLPYPWSKLGQKALIYQEHAVHVYRVTDLPAEAQELSRQLTALLETLQGIPQHALGRLYFERCLLPRGAESLAELLDHNIPAGILKERLRSLFLRRQTRPARPGWTRQEFALHQAAFEEARACLAAQSALSDSPEARAQHRQRFLQLWPELRQVARALARAYYLAAGPALVAVPRRFPLRAFPALEEGDGRGRHLAQSAPRSVSILSDALSLALLSALRSPLYTPDHQGRLVYQQRLALQAPKATLSLEVSFPAHAEKGVEDLPLSDGLVDIWLAVQHLALTRGGTHGQAFACTIRDILALVRPVQTHPDARLLRRTRASLQLLSVGRVRFALQRANSKGGAALEAPLLEVDDPTRPAQMKLGAWVEEVPTRLRRVTTLPLPVLQWHPESSAYAKRLAIVLACLLQEQQEGVHVTLQELLELAGIAWSANNPRRSKQAITNALMLLAGIPAEADPRVRHPDAFLWEWKPARCQEQVVLGAFWVVGAEQGLREHIDGLGRREERFGPWSEEFLRLTLYVLPPAEAGS